jgi:hypothetical protein
MNARTLRLIIFSLLVVCLLAMPSVVTAKPVSEAAWKEYVDGKVAELYQYIDEQIAAVYAYVDEKIAQVGGGGGPDFDLPDPGDWTVEAYTRAEGGQTEGVLTLYASDREKTCTWNGAPIAGWVGSAPDVQTRAIARYDGAPLGYAVGTCRYTSFEGLSELPEAGETVEVDIWFFWMGKEKKTTIPITVASMPPNCSLSADPEYGPAPLVVSFSATTSDPEGDEIVEFRWDFGDGTIIEGSQVEVHSYTDPTTYIPHVRITDATGAVGLCETWVTVEPPQE